MPSEGSGISDLVAASELEGKDYLVVEAAIVNPPWERVGTDIVLFKITAPQELVEDYTGLGETGEEEYAGSQWGGGGGARGRIRSLCRF